VFKKKVIQGNPKGFIEGEKLKFESQSSGFTLKDFHATNFFNAYKTSVVALIKFYKSPTNASGQNLRGWNIARINSFSQDQERV
jgi:hypothetical protein